MINESYPWKRDLLKDADIIERWAAKITNSENREALIEKKIFLAAYVIRKLIESQKLTIRTSAEMVRCRIYPALGTTVDIFNRHDISEYYNFSSEIEASISIGHLTNQIIHSLIFGFEYLEEESRSQICGFFVVSDWQKDKQLYRLSLSDYLSVMRVVGSDKVVKIHSVRTEKGWKISKR